MKKSLFTLLMIAATFMTANAQKTFPIKPQEQKHAHEHEHAHDGRFFVGGAVTFWNDTEDEVMQFDFCPEIGYLFNDDWGVGLLLGYEYESEKSDFGKLVFNAFKVSPFVRYYYFHKEPFNLYLDAGFGGNIGKVGVENSGNYVVDKGFEVGIRPGACVDLTEGLCLCLRMGFIGYRDTYFMGEEEGISSNGFGIRFAPEELMIGLELEF